MTLNVLGGQGVVSGTLTVNTGQSTGEILVFTTSSAADYTAIVTLSLAATFNGLSSLSGVFIVPGAGGGGGFDTSSSSVAAFSGVGVAISRPTTMFGAGAGGVLKVGPGTAVKIPWAWFNSNGSAQVINYIVNYHVAYVRNP